MKKIILCIFYSLLFTPLMHAQLVNGSFEVWDSVTYSDPNSWFTSNLQTVHQAGISNVTQVSGFSGSAVRMETILSGTDTLHAFLSNTSGDPTLGQGGVPYTQQPNAITGYYRYNLQGNDTALLLVTFKKNAVIISSDIFKIRGTGVQNVFTFFSFPISVPAAPDSVIIASTSSNLLANVGVMPGSFLELDQLSFFASIPLLPIPGGDFDSWNTFVYQTPSSWTPLGEGFTITTDSYSGNFAIRLITLDYGNGNIGPGAITNGTNSQTGPAGGVPFTLMTDTLTGYYKYLPSLGDSAVIGISLFANGSAIGGGGTFLTATPTYTYFEFPFSAFSTPDTMRIDIFSSKFPFGPASVGSALQVDNLQLKSQIGTGILQNETSNVHLITYPNPANNVIDFSLDKKIQGAQLIIYDIQGKKMKENTFEDFSNVFHLNISNLPAGLYHYDLLNNGIHLHGEFIKE